MLRFSLRFTRNLEASDLTTHRGWISLLLLTTMAWGQAPKTPAQSAPSKPAALSHAAASPSVSNTGVSGGAAVITIPGLCDKPPADKSAGTSKTSDCKTVVTRAEFERLVDAVAPDLPPANRKQLATQYGVALVMVHKAHEMGLDQGPRFQELMRVARVGVLTKELTQSLQEKAGHVADTEIAKYYHANEAGFQELELQRVFIPRGKQSADDKEKEGADDAKKLQQESEEAMKKLADSLRTRAAAGEDFEKLQEEAFVAANLKGKPPTRLGKVRRSSLPPGQSDVFNLKPGETSQLITAPNGYLVYKAGEKDTLPLDKVSEEIASTLRAQRMQDSVQAIQHGASPELNEKYFAGTMPAATPGTDPGKAGPQAPAKPPESGPK
jgi:hypothetical protein